MVKPRSPATATGQTVSDIMLDPEPVIEQSAHLAAAAYLMRHAHRPELVIVDDEASRTPVGMITAFDVVRAVSHAANPSDATVAQWDMWTTDDFTIGIAGNTDAEFFPVGGGFCFGGTYCSNHILNKGSLDVLFSVMRAPGSAVAIHAGADITNFSPFQLDVRGGALLRFALVGPLALLADPTVSVYVLQREPGAEEFLSVPIRLGYQINDQVNAGLATGLNAPLDSFSTSYAIPAGVMVLLTPNEKLDVGFDFTLANVGGKHAAGQGAFTNKSIALTVNYRL